MKNLFALLLLLCTFTLSAQQADRFTGTMNDRPRDIHADQMNFVPNEVLVKFKDEVTLPAGTKLKSAGINSVDLILKANGAGSLEKLFPAAKKLKNAQIVKDPQGREMKIPNLDNIYKITIPQLKSTGGAPTDIYKFIEELKALPEVEYAEPNFIYSIGDFKPAGPEMSMIEAMNQPANSELPPSALGVIPNDPLYNSQWGIPATKIDVVWNTTTGDSTAIIAILDTGVDWQHPDLAANIWNNKREIPGNGMDDDGNGLIDDVRGWDYINNDNNPMDDNSHGTHVAGIAAAVGNNGIGIAGANWKARIMPIKVFQSSGRGDAATIAKGVTYSATNGATVINMSFGSYAESLTLKNALASAYGTAVLVAAAGNDALCIGPGKCEDGQPGKPMYPGAYSFVMGVEANTKDSKAVFSTFDQDGPAFSEYADLLNYELKAPGVGILSCVPGGNYREYNGTSMAAPLVAGAVSLYRKQKPTDSQELLFGNLINTMGQHIDLEKALSIIPVPNLQIVSYVIKDTIDGDKDGRPDAGETIELKIKVRNTWGQANDVKVGIEFGEFEDNSTATIQTADAAVGSVSAYATKENAIYLKIKLAANVSNARDLLFNLKTWYGDKLGEKKQQIVLPVDNGQELSGVMDTTLTLTSDRLWLVNQSFKIGSNGKLIFKPGTKLIATKKIVNEGQMIGLGTKDSLISIEGILIQNGSLNFSYTDFKLVPGSQDWAPFLSISGVFNYCNFTLIGASNAFCNFGAASNNLTFTNCNFKISATWVFSGYNPVIKFSNLDVSCYGFQTVPSFETCNLITIKSHDKINPNILIKCNILESEPSIGGLSGNYFTLPPNIYFGTTNPNKIANKIVDFFDDPSLAQINFKQNLVTSPFESAHCIVWKVLVNGKDAQDEVVDPVGVGRQRFDVYFNRSMNKTITPQVSFGVRDPYVQQAINEDASWSNDGKIYTVFKTIKLTTGDGINRIRVAGAKETNGWDWEIPVEDRRFEFLISAAGSASAEFMATPGLGKVKMEWNNNTLADGLGFNMYRMEHVNDTVLTLPILINSSLITDTLYTDFSVQPNKKYYYYYKILRTNFAETDSSKVVSAIPFTASKGDANGDLNVNVLDITTIVAYLLNNDPKPFITEAADYNGDGNVNVLDIVGVVNLVLYGGMKSAEIPLNQQVHLYLKNDTLFADAPVAIGGIQFDINGATAVEEIKKLKALEGFESGYSQQKNGLRLLYYSMSGNNIPAGDHIPLLKLKKGSGITEAIFADKMGTPIAVDFLVSEIGKILDNPKKVVAELGQNFPNPFSNLTTIPYLIFEPVDEAVIRVFNIAGQQLKIVRLPNPIVGEHLLQWDSGYPKGMFIYLLEVRQGKKQIICPVRKMIVQ